MRALETLISEKQAALRQERELIDQLNLMLNRLGYRVIPASGITISAKLRRRPAGKKNAAVVDGLPRRRVRRRKSTPKIAAGRPRRGRR